MPLPHDAQGVRGRPGLEAINLSQGTLSDHGLQVGVALRGELRPGRGLSRENRRFGRFRHTLSMSPLKKAAKRSLLTSSSDMPSSAAMAGEWMTNRGSFRGVGFTGT